MPKVHMVNTRDLESDGRREVDQVTSLEASTTPDRSILYLEVGVFHLGMADGRTIPLALTPPAAHQLSELLQTALEKYLQSTPEEPFDVDRFVA